MVQQENLDGVQAGLRGGGILASDPGTGKTFSVLALVAAQRNQQSDQPTLVVVPSEVTIAITVQCF